MVKAIKLFATLLGAELLEEVLEELIIWGVSAALSAVVIKTLSLVTTVGLTVIGKAAFKSLFKVFSKKIIKKEGNDKIEIIKRSVNYMTNTKVKHVLAGIVTLLAVAAVAVTIFVPSLTGCVEYAVGFLLVVLPVDLVAIFTNAKKSAEDIAAAATAKQDKAIEKQVKADFAAQQKAAIDAAIIAKKAEQKPDGTNTI